MSGISNIFFFGVLTIYESLEKNQIPADKEG